MGEKVNELINLIHQWGVDRQIIGNGKLETQWLKLISEFGEMADTLAKGKSPIDDIGDQIVVLVMMAGITGRLGELKSAAANTKPDTLDTMTLCGMLCTTYASLRYYGNQIGGRYYDALNQLGGIASKNDLTLYLCADFAYDQIKHRTGYLNEHGVFIKDAP